MIECNGIRIYFESKCFILLYIHSCLRNLIKQFKDLIVKIGQNASFGLPTTLVDICPFFWITVLNSFNIAIQQLPIGHSNGFFQIARKVIRGGSSFQIAMENFQSVGIPNLFMYMLVEFDGRKTFNKNRILYFSGSPQIHVESSILNSNLC